MATIAQGWIEQGFVQGFARGFAQSVAPDIAQEIAPSIEQSIRQGIEQGVEQGIKQGMEMSAREALLDILTIRFAAVPQGVAQAISQISDPARLRWLRKEAMTVTLLAEFEQVLEV